MANSYTLPMDYPFNIGDLKYSFILIWEQTLLIQSLVLKGNLCYPEKQARLLRWGHDNLGNESYFSLTSVSGEDLVFKHRRSTGDLSDEITSITLIPYAAKYPEQSGKMSDDYKQVGEEFTVFFEEIVIYKHNIQFRS